LWSFVFTENDLGYRQSKKCSTALKWNKKFEIKFESEADIRREFKQCLFIVNYIVWET